MKLGIPTLRKLVILVAGDKDHVTGSQFTPYNSGPQIVSIFSKLGFRNDDYDFNRGGFIIDGIPKKSSRQPYVKDRLNKINDTPEIVELISIILSPERFNNFQSRPDVAAEYLNEELRKDGYQVTIEDGHVILQEGDFESDSSVNILEIIPITSQDSGTFSISNHVSNRIIEHIRHFGRTMESSPTTYKDHPEEELRDIFLAHLNGTFKGSAKGEVFRKNGKTDICIEAENRSAFVAEFKIWHGKSQAISALEQLLNYLTWRDSKASLIFFNKENKEFNAIIPNLASSIAEHELTIKEFTCEQEGEWSFLVHPEEEIQHRINLYVFLFNLYSE